MLFVEHGYGDWVTIRDQWTLDDVLAARRSLERRAKRAREERAAIESMRGRRGY